VRAGILLKSPSTQDTRWGRYVDEFEEREGVWKILHRVVISEWTDVNTIKPNGTDELYTQGRPIQEDPSCRPSSHDGSHTAF